MTAEHFGRVLEYPDADSGERFAGLVGLDHVKTRLINEAVVLLAPHTVGVWLQKHHPAAVAIVRAVTERVPLIVLAGDVGTGKTEIAETVGDPIAKRLKVAVVLYPLSLSTRGTGLVGQMTALITDALAAVRQAAGNARNRDGVLNRAIILLIDEADSVAQSRELAQMHHEDRAGVNALIQGIDGFRRDNLPVLSLMCTNRLDAIDPAVARRAAHIFEFTRPDDDQRRCVLLQQLAGTGVAPEDVDRATQLLGATEDRAYGATYSDLRQRFVPDVVLDAFERDEPITGEGIINFAGVFTPTRPFAKSA